MKRKALCILLSLLLTATLFGCSGGDVSVAFSAVKPWEYAGYEKCTYEVKRVYTADGGETVVADGTYTTELTTSGDLTSVTNKFELQYNENAHANNVDLTGRTVRNKNMKDSYESTAIFRKDSMVPVGIATKTFDIGQRPLTDGTMGARENNPKEGVAYRYEMDGADKYGDPQGDTYTINYDTNESSITTTVGSTVQEDGVYYRNYVEKTKSFTLGSGTRYDNEQLPYLVRALANMQVKGSATFYLTNMADSYVRDAYVRHTMSLSCANKTTAVSLEAFNDYLLYNKEGELNKNDFNEYSVPCVRASVGLSDAKSGPAIELLISDPSIFFVRSDKYFANPEGSAQELFATNRVIMSMTYTEYALSAARVAYKTIYTLVDYTTVR